MIPILALDIGGTRVRAAVVCDSRLVTRHEALWPRSDQPGDPYRDLTLVLEVAAHAQASGASPAIAGVALAASVDSDGIARFWPNRPWWEGAPVRAVLEHGLGLPVVIGDDASVSALAEATFGAGRLFRCLLGVSAGTGIGGGLVTDGRLHHGARGWSGNLGHVVLDANGPRCPCGRHGCLQMRAGGRAVDSGEVTVGNAGRALGEAVGALATCLDLDGVVVIDGGLARAGDAWWEPLRSGFRSTAHPADVALVAGELGDNAGLIGAAVVAGMT